MISIITPALVKDAQGIEWLNEAIASVHHQTVGDWEMVVINDHSPANLAILKAAWPKVRWLDAEGHGVSAARNQAAEAAQGDLLLPLDADDKLAPEALERFMGAWKTRTDADIVYSDVVMFGEDYAQVYLAPEYDFRTLLKATFMTVGCLHRKADWERIGGWRLDMSMGLEDWEYWIAMGEAGVCGERVAEPLYWYRRHPRGRLQWLKANRELWDKSYQAMRELHRQSFNGRYPMGCCGGKAPKGARAPLHGGVPRAPMKGSPELPADKIVQMVYRGARKGDFMLVSGVTRTQYHVKGQGEFVEMLNGRRGVNPADVEWFRSVNQGRDFIIVAPPKPAPEVRPVQVTVEEPRAESPAWTPEIMSAEETKPAQIDIQEGAPKRARKTRRADTG